MLRGVSYPKCLRISLIDNFGHDEQSTWRRPILQSAYNRAHHAIPQGISDELNRNAPK